MDPLATIAQELLATTNTLDRDQLHAATHQLLQADRIFLGGAGRSGLAMRAFAMRLMHLGLHVHVLGETTTPAITASDLLIIGSGSGRTPSLLAAAQKAADLKTPIILITTGSASPIADLAHTTIIIPAQSSKLKTSTGITSAQPMSSLFEQTLWLTGDAIIMLLMDHLHQTSEQMFTRHANLE